MAQKTSINIKPCNIGSSEHITKEQQNTSLISTKRGFMSVLTLWLQTKYG